MSLDGRVAVITGGNGGIGLGMAAGIARAGADIAIWARDEVKNEAAARHIAEVAPERRVITLACDVADPASIADAVAATTSALGRIDACIANAGVSGAVPFLDVTPEQWRAVMAVNLDGTFFTLQAAARQMVAQGGGGALVAVSSTSAIHGAPLQSHYAASKTALLGLVRSAAVALARHGIRVNALLPGWTLTDLSRPGYEMDRFRDATVGRTPVRRWADPAEFAAVGAYLADPDLTFHTGDALTVDGGYTVF